MVDAVRCAIEVQSGMIERNAGAAARPPYRIPHRRHIWATSSRKADGDLNGHDGVNIAACASRVRICAPCAICLSEDAYRQVKGRLDVAARDLGPIQLKNIAEPIRVYSARSRRPRPGEARVGASARKIRPAAPLDRGPAVRQYRRRPGAGALRRRRHGEPDDRSVAQFRGAGRDRIRNTAFTYKGKPLEVKDDRGAS